MKPEDVQALTEQVLGGADGPEAKGAALVLADVAAEQADQALRAAALDRAYGLDPSDQTVATQRQDALEALAISEHGLRFRFVPAGTTLIGSTTGDPDEQPVHRVRTLGFWLTDVPVSWGDYCRMLGWEGGRPTAGGGFALGLENRIRAHYCEGVDRADDWPAPESPGEPTWFDKPMVAVSWQSAEELAEALSTPQVSYGLPTEAEWERAARGGLVGKRYAWGDEPPDPSRADFGHFGTFTIRPPRELAPNGYGLFGMCGGVWEWTADVYDALAYHPRRPPLAFTEQNPRVVRGGCFVDDAAALTVSFRAGLAASHWRADGHGEHLTPTVGFRLVRRLGPRQAAPIASPATRAPAPVAPPAPSAQAPTPPRFVRAPESVGRRLSSALGRLFRRR